MVFEHSGGRDFDLPLPRHSHFKLRGYPYGVFEHSASPVAGSPPPLGLLSPEVSCSCSSKPANRRSSALVPLVYVGSHQSCDRTGDCDSPTPTVSSVGPQEPRPLRPRPTRRVTREQRVDRGRPSSCTHTPAPRYLCSLVRVLRRCTLSLCPLSSQQNLASH